MTPEQQLRVLQQQKQDKLTLMKMADQTITRTMIGSLACCEKHLGYLWGHGLSEEELDEDQKRWRALWQLIRFEILENGHTQLRDMKSAISRCNIKWMS